MLFITNRQPQKKTISSKSLKNKDHFDFDFGRNAPDNHVHFCDRISENLYIEIGQYDFFRKIVKSQFSEIIFYIHGFNNNPEQHIFPDSLCFKKLLKEKDLDTSILLIPIIWPCDNDLGLTQDYWDDQKASDMSSLSFGRLILKFMKWQNLQSDVCDIRMNVLAHSMGNRVLRETLHDLVHYDLFFGMPLLFKNVFMAAPDLVNNTLQHNMRGCSISYAAKNVIVYYSSNDLALRSSKTLNCKNKVASRRLGHTGSEKSKFLPKNITCIDCDSVSNIYDPPFGHKYFLLDETGEKSGKVFHHIINCLTSNMVNNTL